jgi:5-methylcytosine-specific restriction endonuclease McrA
LPAEIPKAIPKEFLERAKAVTAKRARTVIDHIIEHGSITTEELRTMYGYADPRRALQDVRDQGIPLERFKVKGSDGRSIGAHRFDLACVASRDRLGGRKAFPKVTKQALIARDGYRCAICKIEYDPQYLQVDHCVPYIIAGESLSDDLDQLMLLCGSCNRSKSWTCEHHCPNLQKKDIKACQSCYWVSPDKYEHTALVQIRRVDIGWRGEEVKVFDRLLATSKKQSVSVQDLVKRIVKDSPLLK